MVREHTVRDLMWAANEALVPVVERTDASATEIVSAYLSLARVAILTARLLGMNPARLRHAVQELLLDCAEDTKPC